jgi:hypothetical protein
VTDLERLFRRLVANLAASDPARLHHPIPLDDIQGSIVPYRTSRRALEVDTSEDYELLLLRLCAGEGNLVRTEPEEVRALFATELASPNPDLDVLRKFEGVVISLRSEPLARALGPEPDRAYAPPAFAEPARPGSNLTDSDPADSDLAETDLTEADVSEADLPETDPGSSELDPLDGLDVLDDEPLPDDEDEAAPAPHCLYCGGAIPTDRPVRFCPHCGQRQTPPECPRCHSEVDPGWRHCVSCGAALAG